MKHFKTLEGIAKLLVMISLMGAPLNGQHRRTGTGTTKPSPAPPASKREPVPTFDTLLASDSYKLYAEVRGVGQLIRSGGVNDILDPIIKLAGPPKEFKTIVKWLNAHADEVMTSRVMVAAWPVRGKTPQTLIAIDFPSAEEAQKFEPQLSDFLSIVIPAIPKPSPSPSPSPSAEPSASGTTTAGKNDSATTQTKGAKPPAPRYLIKQSGSLVIISDTSFSFRTLRPAGSKLLTEDQNFRMAHDRFASEQMFLYFNVALSDRETQERAAKLAEEQKQLESEIASRQDSDEQATTSAVNETKPVVESKASSSPVPVSISSSQPTLSVHSSQNQAIVSEGPPAVDQSSKGGESANMMLFLFGSGFFGGSPKWPEAVGGAIAFDSDAYVIRILLLNGSDARASAIPFFPQFTSGPALIPESPSILPADTELFVTASIDYPQIYDGMIKSVANENEAMRRRTHQIIRENETESPFAFYEKKLGIKIKEELLPLLGNEIALTLPMRSLGGTPFHTGPSSSPEQPSEENSTRKNKQPADPSPIIAISIKDKEGVRLMLPKLIESFGLKGASLLAQTEKRDDTELVSYADALAYAFIGDFLVISSSTAATRHVVDSYLNHQTLAADGRFRNFTRWQPRQVLGQIYVSPAVMEGYQSLAGDMTSSIDERLRDLITRIGPISEPVTYALANEGMGPLHELHLPKNLVALMMAGISSGAGASPLITNEAITRSAIRTIASAETTYKATKGNGSFGSLDEIISEAFVSKEMIQNYGYRVELTASGNKFEVSAVPLEYGKSGKMSFFLDETGVLRGGDHGGGPATISDQPLQ